MDRILIYNQSHPENQPVQARYCATFGSRLRGLMFRKSLGTHEGICMVQPRADRVDAAIHMFFMNFDIAVVWADEARKVVDVQLARRWRPMYAPASAAKFVIETHPDRQQDYQIGDQLVWEKC